MASVDVVNVRTEREIADRLGEQGLALNGYAMRCYSGDAFKLEASTQCSGNEEFRGPGQRSRQVY
jgi:hypothetical protein